MELKAALKGNLKEYMKKEYQAGQYAVTEGVREATTGLKMALRRQVMASGLHNARNLAKSWRSTVYPEKGKKSFGAAGVVETKAPDIMRGLNEGKVIRSKDGRWLAIPTKNAPKRGRGGKRIKPSNFPEHRFGKLRFVYRRGGPSLLVADNVRASYSQKTGELRGFKKASKRALKSGKGLTTAVMFLLVPQVRMKKLICVESEAAKWQGRVDDLILKHWKDVKA